MRAWTLDDFGFDNLNLREIPTPEPAAGQLLVKVAAASLNYRDKALVEGIYAPEKMPKGLVPVADFAGVVAATGTGVTKYAVGDRVTSGDRWAAGSPSTNCSVRTPWCPPRPR